MSNKISDVNLLKKHIENLNKSIERLLYSYNVCNAIDIKCEQKTEEYWEHYEALTARYGRSVYIAKNAIANLKKCYCQLKPSHFPHTSGF